jgi:hypothetical protein
MRNLETGIHHIRLTCMDSDYKMSIYIFQKLLAQGGKMISAHVGASIISRRAVPVYNIFGKKELPTTDQIFNSAKFWR